jgi:hypothetical protein
MLLPVLLLLFCCCPAGPLDALLGDGVWRSSALVVALCSSLLLCLGLLLFVFCACLWYSITAKFFHVVFGLNADSPGHHAAACLLLLLPHRPA